jgi:pimeloyl-ACP methyl ester carboxylesterase
MIPYRFALMVLAGAVLAGCGGGGSDGPAIDNSLARGSLVANPPNLVPVPQPDGSYAAKLEPALLKAKLDAAGQTAVTGVPKCAISVYYMEYGTVGGAGETTNGTGAIMVPSGTDPACVGPRPVVLYAHGTTTDKNFNMAQLDKNSEASFQAAMYAAQGFIVVAPNYAGYGVSKLSYHPYLNAEQSANDMIDALRAARKAFPVIGAAGSDKLLITGYSQGGHVAMATQRAMQLNYASEFKVTALAGQSGPYAMSLLGDITFGGTPNLGATIFFPMISTSWQKSYGGLYTSPSDMYEAQYATGIESLLPSTTPDTIYSSGKLPQLALFAADSLPQTPPFVPGSFGPNNLIKTSFRNTYLADMAAHPCNANPADPLNCAPANPFRKAGIKNDLRNYVPNVPVLLCGGHGDPTVFWASTQMTQGYFTAKGMPAALLQPALDVDVDPATINPADPFAGPKMIFNQLKAKTAAAAGANAATAVVTAYHGSLVPPACGAAARGFFQSVLAQ